MLVKTCILHKYKQCYKENKIRNIYCVTYPTLYLTKYVFITIHVYSNFQNLCQINLLMQASNLLYY